jgi:hypothetical protein
MIEFIRGAWTAERMTLTPAAWNTASNASVKLASLSCSTNFARVGIFQVHEQVPGLLHDPGLDRVPGGTEDPDAAGAKLDYSQDVVLRAVEEIGGEEVQRQDPLCLRSRELRPARPVPARRRIDPRALQDLPYRRRRYRDTEPGQLAVNAAVPP